MIGHFESLGAKNVNKPVLLIKIYARHLTGDTGYTGHYFSMCAALLYHFNVIYIKKINNEHQVSSYGRTINFESYQPITFANRLHFWGIHTC